MCIRDRLDVDPQVKAASLGSGQLQMLAIMRAIQKSPRILVLDEPTSALDDNEVNILFRFLEKMRRKGVSCIFITHKLDEVFRIANRVVVMLSLIHISMYTARPALAPGRTFAIKLRSGPRRRPNRRN